MAASVNDKFLKVGVAGTLTSLSSPGKAIGAASINIGSGSNWPTDTGVLFAIRQVDSSGNLVAGTYTEWVGTLSGTTISGLTGTPAYGSDQVYPAGTTTQVYIPVSAYRDNRMVDGLVVEHNQDGTHKGITSTGASLTSPTFQGSIDGWVGANESWTYASSTTITVPTGAASKYRVGDKVKLTQSSTVKYFYIVGVADTVLTVAAGTDYTVANSAITANYYSHTGTPLNFPGWFAYTPTWTGYSSTPGYTVRFKIDGRICFVAIANGGTLTSNDVTLTFTLPVTSATQTGMNWATFLGPCADNSAACGASVVIGSNATTASCFKNNAGSGNTWTNTNNKWIDGIVSYEI